MTLISASTPIILELGLDVLGHDAGLGQVAAHDIAVGDIGLEDAVRVVDALFGQDLLGHFGVVLVPVLLPRCSQRCWAA